MIWCVEDDASIRDIEVYALQSTGVEAKGFEDGDSFLSALKTERPELVILDVMLPGTDGIEVLKILKSTAEYNVSDTEKEAALTVSDNGIGIAPQHHARIFERFYRVDKSHSKKSGGTGLGLSIVKHSVQYHGGKIAIQSEENKGTTVTVALPKRK